MIELNEKTQHDFLNREWVQNLLDAGVDMSDAKYCIVDGPGRLYDIVTLKKSYDEVNNPWIDDGLMTAEKAVKLHNYCPTYTVSELLYKLHEWEEENIGDRECRGDVCFMPDAPYYMSFFHLVGDETVEIYNDMCGMSESPIESLASLLIQCHRKKVM